MDACLTVACSNGTTKTKETAQDVHTSQCPRQCDTTARLMTIWRDKELWIDSNYQPENQRGTIPAGKESYLQQR